MFAILCVYHERNDSFFFSFLCIQDITKVLIDMPHVMPSQQVPVSGLKALNFLWTTIMWCHPCFCWENVIFYEIKKASLIFTLISLLFIESPYFCSFLRWSCAFNFFLEFPSIKRSIQWSWLPKDVISYKQPVYLFLQ